MISGSSARVDIGGSLHPFREALETREAAGKDQYADGDLAWGRGSVVGVVGVELIVGSGGGDGGSGGGGGSGSGGGGGGIACW